MPDTVFGGRARPQHRHSWSRAGRFLARLVLALGVGVATAALL